jgi:hypothetical protein
MGPCIVSIFQYITNKMQSYTVYLYLETALHVSGGTSTHHQERLQRQVRKRDDLTTFMCRTSRNSGALTPKATRPVVGLLYHLTLLISYLNNNLLEMTNLLKFTINARNVSLNIQFNSCAKMACCSSELIFPFVYALQQHPKLQREIRLVYPHFFIKLRYLLTPQTKT